MNMFGKLRWELQNTPRQWLVTGCAGFIGSNLLEFLLKHGQRVVGLDNFASGYRHNLDEVRASVSDVEWRQFHLIEGDVRDLETCCRAIAGADYVLHQATPAPGALNAPHAPNDSNANGFLNMVVAAQDEGVSSFVFAAAAPAPEDGVGGVLSPWGGTNYVKQLYAQVFARCYGFRSVGLRYFNVFGQRQHPECPYAGVIPRWIATMSRGEDVVIDGDGCTGRDFCHVANAVQANILAALLHRDRMSEVYNVAVGDATSPNRLFGYIKAILRAHGIDTPERPLYAGCREGDLVLAQADIGKAARELGYAPEYRIFAGLEATVAWYLRRKGGIAAAPAGGVAAMPDRVPVAARRTMGLLSPEAK